jgi:hypothetical protein
MEYDMARTSPPLVYGQTWYILDVSATLFYTDTQMGMLTLEPAHLTM